MSEFLDANSELIQLKLEKLERLEEQERLRVGLPFLYAQKHYEWSHRLENSKAKRLICIAGNQGGKSTTAIKRLLRYITESERWAERWPELTARGGKPTLFWTCYPNSDTASMEFSQKWEPLMPQGEFKESEKYGWKAKYSNGRIHSVEWNNGITLEFRSYAQDIHNLQSGSCSYINMDEEPPFEVMPELLLRLEACSGFLAVIFTPTRAQEEWRQIIEDRTNWIEDDVEVIKVSLFDCCTYIDGSPGIWSEEKIERLKKRLSTPAEIAKRIYGEFVLDEGLKYSAFQRKQHVIKGHPLPKDWGYYVGADYGGGGDSTSKVSHPSAICVLAVSPDYTRGRVVKTWRGDNTLTTTDDVVKKYIEMTHGLPVIACFYDWGSKDLGTIASRLGLPFFPAEKSHEIGEATINTLFKNNALKIQDNSGFTEQLCRELESLLKSTNKKSARDDLCDAMRYSLTKVPWNFDLITKALPEEPQAPEPTAEEYEMKSRRGEKIDHTWGDPEDQESVDAEISFWNSQY